VELKWVIPGTQHDRAGTVCHIGRISSGNGSLGMMEGKPQRPLSKQTEVQLEPFKVRTFAIESGRGLDSEFRALDDVVRKLVIVTNGLEQYHIAENARAGSCW
jgi:hypothetical protein